MWGSAAFLTFMSLDQVRYLPWISDEISPTIVLQVLHIPLCFYFDSALNFLSFVSEKPKREKRLSRFAWSRWGRSRRKRRRWAGALAHTFTLLQTNTSIRRPPSALPDWKEICVLFFCCASFPTDKEIVASVKWHGICGGTGTQSNILITARPVPTHVTLHTHSCCSIELPYRAIAHSLILKAKRTKAWGSSRTQACAQTHRLSKHTYSPENNYCMRTGGKQTHTHTLICRDTVTHAGK